MWPDAHAVRDLCSLQVRAISHIFSDPIPIPIVGHRHGHRHRLLLLLALLPLLLLPCRPPIIPSIRVHCPPTGRAHVHTRTEGARDNKPHQREAANHGGDIEEGVRVGRREANQYLLLARVAGRARLHDIVKARRRENSQVERPPRAAAFGHRHDRIVQLVPIVIDRQPALATPARTRRPRGAPVARAARLMVARITAVASSCDN